MLENLRSLPRPLFCLYAGTTITRLGSFVFPFLTVYLATTRGFSTGIVGTVLSLGSLGLLLGNLTGGILSDAWNSKNTLIAALLLNACGFLGLAWLYSSAWFYAGFLFIGYFGSGMYTPAANSLIADLTDDGTRAFAYTVNYVCINLGMSMGPLLGGFLAAKSYSLVFFGDVLTSLACAVLLVWGIPKRLKTAKNHGSASSASPTNNNIWQAWLRSPAVFFFCCATFFLLSPLMGLEYTVPLLVQRELGKSLTYVGFVYTINAVCILSFSFLLERWARGKNEISVMILAAVFWLIGLSILKFGFSTPALLLCTVVWTIGEILASITVPTYISRHVHTSVKGRFLALTDAMRSLAGIVCPISLGFLWQAKGAHSVLQILLILPAIGLAAYAGLAFVSRSQRACPGSIPVTPPTPPSA